MKALQSRAICHDWITKQNQNALMCTLLEINKETISLGFVKRKSVHIMPLLGTQFECLLHYLYFILIWAIFVAKYINYISFFTFVQHVPLGKVEE
jgi:hypothetical protein